MNCAIVSAILLSVAVLATTLPIERPSCWIFSLSTRKFVKLSANGTVTADGQIYDAAVYVHYIAGTSPQQFTVESVKSTPDNVCFLTVEDGVVKSGTPMNGNEIFERVPVSPLVYALRVVNPNQVDVGSGSGEPDVDYYLGFSPDTYEAGLYESIVTNYHETKFIFLPNHEQV